MARKQTKSTDVQKSIINLCLAAGALVERPNGGGGMLNGQYVQFNAWYYQTAKQRKKGQADLKVFFPNCAPIAVEIKRDAKDKLRPEQEMYAAAWCGLGNHFVVATSVEEFVAYFDGRNIGLYRELSEVMRSGYGYQ